MVAAHRLACPPIRRGHVATIAAKLAIETDVTEQHGQRRVPTLLADFQTHLSAHLCRCLLADAVSEAQTVMLRQVLFN
jgi:hypothetical protein